MRWDAYSLSGQLLDPISAPELYSRFMLAARTDPLASLEFDTANTAPKSMVFVLKVQLGTADTNKYLNPAEVKVVVNLGCHKEKLTNFWTKSTLANIVSYENNKATLVYPVTAVKTLVRVPLTEIFRMKSDFENCLPASVVSLTSNDSLRLEREELVFTFENPQFKLLQIELQETRFMTKAEVTIRLCDDQPKLRYSESRTLNFALGSGEQNFDLSTLFIAEYKHPTICKSEGYSISVTQNPVNATFKNVKLDSGRLRIKTDEVGSTELFAIMTSLGSNLSAWVNLRIEVSSGLPLFPKPAVPETKPAEIPKNQ